MDTIQLKDVKEDKVYNILVPWGKGYKKAIGRLFKEREGKCENVYLISDDAGIGFEKPADVIFLSEIGNVT
jgi:hypothetical protein